MSNNYIAYHLHSDYSLGDSTTDYRLYIEKAVSLGQKAIAFTEHGNVYNWVNKKMACDKAGIKYIHGVEIYLTRTNDENEGVRDNYHTILLAKNLDGVKEINSLVSLSNRKDHVYYNPRITFDEFLGISNNVIKISACIMSPLAQLDKEDPYFMKLARKYDYFEVQPHVDFQEQMFYNLELMELANKLNKPLIAGTDTHSLNAYKAECRQLLYDAKKKDYENELDLTYKSYDELVYMFKKQNALPEYAYLQAIENTNRMADTVESFELDTSFKYPILHGSAEKDEQIYFEKIDKLLEQKIKDGVIPESQREGFNKAIEEEKRVFHKIGMSGFMLSMSEMIEWAKDNDIAVGNARGSVGGSRAAYVTNIIDLNPETWGTVFSRFANEDRKELGDIDVDVAPRDRWKVYKHIIDRFGQEKTSYVLAIGTMAELGTIDEIGRGLDFRWRKRNGVDIKSKDVEMKSPYHLRKIAEVKELYKENPDEAKKKYPKIFYYFDGMVNTKISRSVHPAGIIVSPITIRDNYGTTFGKDPDTGEEKEIIQIDMDACHEVGLVKYDILGLKNVQIIYDACKLAGIRYPKSHEIDWYDQAVWQDMVRSPIGVFQFEGKEKIALVKLSEPRNLGCTLHA